MPALSSSRPSGLKVTAYTRSVCPSRTATHSPLPISQIRTSRSSQPVARRSPSGLNAMERTRPWWSASLTTRRPLGRYQTQTLSSSLAVAMWSPAGLNASAHTWSVSTSSSRS